MAKQLFHVSGCSSKQSMCLVFLTAANNKWEIKSLDIKAAFLQGDKIGRDVFLRPPGDVRKRCFSQTTR